MARITAALLLALPLLAKAADYTVRVRNLTYLQPFSPILVVAHTNDVSLFQEGFEASDAVKSMAETGSPAALVELAASDGVSDYICGYSVADGALFPGETWRGDLYVDTDKCSGKVYYSLVSMLINTNDAFVGIDSVRLKTTGNSKAYPPAFDAGTEVNNEMCASIPGPACESDSGNTEDIPGEGFVHVHRGVHGVGDISMSAYDWRNPVAEVFIKAS